MIPASLLLILVAVTLLVLGLTGGSSNLLISSIVASLLAAVALVIGARRAAGARRAEGTAPGFADSSVTGSEFAAAQFTDGPTDPRSAGGQVSDPRFADRDPQADAQFIDPRSAGPDFAGSRPADPAGRGLDDPAGPQFAESQFAEPQFAEPQFADSQFVAEPAFAAAAEADRRGDVVADPRVHAEPVAPDYDRAADTISAARSGNRDDNARRDPVGAAPGEIVEADAEDPADEPSPQAVRPVDAVRLARLDTEVLVVDGRPRYHLPDCAHLHNRLTESLPVNEAVELGFSPCGLCRPADRLVAAARR